MIALACDHGALELKLAVKLPSGGKGHRLPGFWHRHRR